MARMGNERLSKRVMFGEVEGGKGYSSREGEYRTNELPRKRSIVVQRAPKAKHWTLVAKNPGKAVKKCQVSGREVHEALARYGEGKIVKGHLQRLRYKHRTNLRLC